MAHLALRLVSFALISAAASFVAAGCGSPDPEDQAGDDMSSALSAANTENDRHASECLSATALDGMLSLQERHDETMSHVMSQMDKAREHMRQGANMSMHCSGAEFEHMSASLVGLHMEIGEHSERMRTAASLDAARTECSGHTDRMRQLMRGMAGDLHTMPCMGM